VRKFVQRNLPSWKTWDRRKLQVMNILFITRVEAYKVVVVAGLTRAAKVKLHFQHWHKLNDQQGASKPRLLPWWLWEHHTKQISEAVSGSLPAQG
jgi:hypothetical protein